MRSRGGGIQSYQVDEDVLAGDLVDGFNITVTPIVSFDVLGAYFEYNPFSWGIGELQRAVDPEGRRLL